MSPNILKLVFAKADLSRVTQTQMFWQLFVLSDIMPVKNQECPE
jgi:hypothetical protein